MYKIYYSKKYPDVNSPIIYALNYKPNPTLLLSSHQKNQLYLKYSLPPEIYWELRTIRSQFPRDLLLNIGKYLYKFNIYCQPKYKHLKVEIVI